MPPPRLLLRPLTVADAETLAAWGADEVFCAHAGWTPHRTRGEAIAWWEALIDEPDPKLLRLIAVHDSQAVGYVDLYDDGASRRELGFLVGPARRWGHGLGTAVARAGLAYGFGSLGLLSIWAEAVGANTASVRILQGVGMREVAGGEAQTFLGRPSRYRRFETHRDDWVARLDRSAPGPRLSSTP